MLKASWIPTPLVADDRRPPVPIRTPAPPSRYRELYIAGQFLLLAVSLLAMALRPGRHDTNRMARRVREMFEHLGGLWIKAGQVIALRIDLLPEALSRELSRLQSQALGFPADVARAIVEADLGGPVEQFFDEWVPTPVAAASIGQVHRARLRREGTWVAVKVQKPYSAELFARDFTVIEWMVRVVEWVRLLPHLKWQEGLYELRQIMREELDFAYEASSTRRMRKVLKRHGVYAPKVFTDYCTARVMVTEYLHMVLMVDYLRMAREDPEWLAHWREENDVDPRRVARRLVFTFQRQMLENNLFHGDLHPGNIGLLRRSRVALIDFGTTNFTEADYLWRFRSLMRTLATGEFAKCADMSLMLCGRLPAIDLSMVHARLTRTMQSWATRTWVRELPFHDKSMGNLTNEVMQVLLGGRCTMEWAWLRLHRASSTLDASLMELAPGIDYRKITAQSFARFERRRLRLAVTALGRRRAVLALDAIGRRPEALAEYMNAQTALIRRQVQVFRGVSQRAAAAITGLVAIGRLAVLAQAGVTVGLAASGWWAVTNPAFADWLRGPGTGPELRPLLFVLAVDVWLWFALARLRRAVGDGQIYLHQRTAAS